MTTKNEKDYQPVKRENVDPAAVSTPPFYKSIPVEHRIKPRELRELAQHVPSTSVWCINNSTVSDNAVMGQLPSGEISHAMKSGDETITLKLLRTRIPQDVTAHGVTVSDLAGSTRFIQMMQTSLETGREPQIIVVSEEYAQALIESGWGASERARIAEQNAVLQSLLHKGGGDTNTAMFTDDQQRRTEVIDPEDVWSKRAEHMRENAGTIEPQWGDAPSEVGQELISMVKTTNTMNVEKDAIAWFQRRATYSQSEARYIEKETRWPRIREVMKNAINGPAV